MTKTIKKGFTIIELLIVIVVIGILAGIVTVTYQGIQNRAKTTAASTAAKEVKDKAEVYNSEISSYPTLAQLKANAVNPAGTTDEEKQLVPTAKLGTETSAKLLDTEPADSTAWSNNKDKMFYAQCSNEGVVTGARVVYWDYEAKATKTVTTGECN